MPAVTFIPLLAALNVALFDRGSTKQIGSTMREDAGGVVALISFVRS
jgi:hypothetical protein